jgi:hypothetical protein
MNNYLSDYQRRVKSLTQRFLLIGINVIDNDTICCNILGSSGQIYTIEIVVEKHLGKILAHCNCPDCAIRKVNCKHMYWFGTKKLGVADPCQWTSELLDFFIVNNSQFYDNYAIGRNEVCPICLETMDYKTEHTICCTETCQNSVHAICWKRYHFTSFSNQCVVCRSNSMPTIF